jgi:hypothetical protein
MRQRTRVLGRQILVEGSPGRHVDQLDAPADGQYGQTIGERPSSQGKLGLIKRIVHLSQAGMGLITIVPGVDVYSSRKQQPIQTAVDAVTGVLLESQREKHRRATRQRHRLHVRETLAV